MRKVFAFSFAIMMASLLISGCDAFRRLAGRPTSDQIEAKRRAIVAGQEARQHLLDSIADANESIEDSLYFVLEDAPEMQEPSLPASGSNCYYVVIGSFASCENAARMARIASESGYEAVLLDFANGKTGVGICPRSTPEMAEDALQKVLREPFCPREAWVYEKKQ